MLFVSITVLLSCFIQAYKKNTFFFEKGTRNLSSKFINERELDLNWLSVSLHCIYRKIAFDFDKSTVFYKQTWLQEINVLLWHKHSLSKWKETTQTTPNMKCYGVEIVYATKEFVHLHFSHHLWLFCLFQLLHKDWKYLFTTEFVIIPKNPARIFISNW